MSLADFTITPHIGLGPLKFGSTAQDNLALQDIYGDIRNIDRTGNCSYWEENISQETDLQQKAMFEKILITLRELNYTLITYYYGNHIFACYKNDKLVEIGVNNKSLDIYYNDVNLFKDNQKNVVDSFIKELGEYPYIDDPQIYFKNAVMTLSCFIEDVVDGKVLWAEDDSETAEQKSMAFNMRINISDEEFDTYFRYKA